MFKVNNKNTRTTSMTKLCLPTNFHTRILGEITVFYAVSSTDVLTAVNYFRKKAPSYMFHRILNTPQNS